MDIETIRLITTIMVILTIIQAGINGIPVTDFINAHPILTLMLLSFIL